MLNITKFSGGTNGLSVFKDSTTTYSSTEDNMGGIKPNSYLKFNNSDILYLVISSKKVLFSKDFESLGNRQIKLNSDIGLKIQNEDTIRLIYNEYELDYVFDIKSGGQNYVESDILSIKGGELSIRHLDGIGTPIQLSISKIDKDGGIIKGIEIKNRGRYYISPDGEPEIYGSNIGDGAKFKLQYRKTESPDSQEKVIKNVEIKDNTTILSLDYSLDPGIKNGQISFEKWELILSIPYYNSSQKNLNYRIFSEFTPNYKFPLTFKNNNDGDLIFNQFANQVDNQLYIQNCEINNLKETVKKLEDKINYK